MTLTQPMTPVHAATFDSRPSGDWNAEDPSMPITAETDYEQSFNHDLLIDEESRAWARARFHASYHVLDHQALRAEFETHDRRAGERKKRSRTAGILAIGLACVSLLAASSEALWGGLPGSWPGGIGLIAGLTGVVCVAIGLFGVLHSGPKRDWLYARFMTERLRQMHFQSMIFDIEAAAASLDGDHERLELSRTRWLEDFLHDHAKNLPARFEETLDSPADGWLFPDVAPRVPDSPCDELIEAYARLRIQHQSDYATFKLRESSGWSDLTLRGQRRVLRTIWLTAVLALFLLHVGIVAQLSFDGIASLLGSLGTASAGASDSKVVYQVAVLWLSVLALTARTLQEALQLDREIERYRDYQSAVENVGLRFEETKDLLGRLSLMVEMERLAYQEFRSFLRTHNEASFVL